MFQVFLPALVLLAPPVTAAAEAPSGPTAGTEPVAIVCLLEGRATVTGDASAPARELRLFDRLVPAATVETGGSSTVVLAFADGRRFMLQAASRARVSPRGLEELEGTVRELERLPELVDLPPLLDVGPLERAGATRVRSSSLGRGDVIDLYPSRGAAVVAGESVLRFSALDGVRRYRVELEDEAGRELLAVETGASPVSVPAGILDPGASYYWRVTTLDGRRPALRADAVFATVGAREAVARAALARRAAADDDLAVRLILLEIDRRLGLVREACAGLEALRGQGREEASQWELQCE